MISIFISLLTEVIDGFCYKLRLLCLSTPQTAEINERPREVTWVDETSNEISCRKQISKATFFIVAFYKNIFQFSFNKRLIAHMPGVFQIDRIVRAFRSSWPTTKRGKKAIKHKHLNDTVVQTWNFNRCVQNNRGCIFLKPLPKRPPCNAVCFNQTDDTLGRLSNEDRMPSACKCRL